MTGEPPGKEPLRVLLVEDDEADARLICRELEKGGFSVVSERVDTEPTYREALTERPWDLVLSDFAMPKFDGLRAFEILKALNRDIPFVFVSGAIGEDRAVAAMRAGARDYIVKGNLGRLCVAVRRELAEAEVRAARHLAEEEARSEQRRLAMAVEASGAGIFEHGIGSDAAAYHSERFCQILGLEPTRHVDSPREWIERVHADDATAVRKAYAEFLAGHRDRFAAEFRIAHRSGRWVDAAAYATAISRDEAQRATYVVGVLMDVTERRRLESQVLQAQKMDAIGRLAGAVAHDFNNLLTVILGFGRLVLDALPEHDDARRRHMSEVIKAADKAQQLTGQLLAFSRRKPVSPRVVNLNTVLGDVLKLLNRLLGERVQLATLLADDLWNTRIDPASLEQVIVNLAVNARDAMPNGGRLTIESMNVRVGSDYTIPAVEHMEPGEYVVLSMADTGTGIDEATLGHMFEPFFTTKEGGKGTGLGLSTCYGAVKQAGGYIGVETAIGSGTTIKVYLPRVAMDADPPQPRREFSGQRGTECVLVVEDDDQVRDIVTTILRRFGYRVISANNGPHALAVSAEHQGTLHLVITDIVMPEMSGPALMEKLKETRPEARVLYISGYTADAVSQDGVLGPGAHLLQKPFLPDRLARLVREILDETRDPPESSR